MNPIWLLLLLPLAAAGGWLGATGYRNLKPRQGFDLPGEYFTGLNFLLNEQPDKAIEVFLKVVEVDSDTIDVHLALGSLFRRRGEVERATRIHQNLIARPNLDRRQRTQAMFELGQDYFKAGLLDRAESLFQELADMRGHDAIAYRHLLQVYEQERDWTKCLAMARKLAISSGESIETDMAQYCCEMADSDLAEGRYESVRHYCQQALSIDPICVRATIQLGRLEAALGNHSDAIEIWKRVETQDSRFVGEVVELVLASYRVLNMPDAAIGFLRTALERHREPVLVLAMAGLLEAQDGPIEAEGFLVDWLRKHPSIYGLHRLIQLRLQIAEAPVRRDLDLLDRMIGGIIDREPSYECQRCGFAGRRLHWQCPSCKGWSRMLPVTARHVLEPEFFEQDLPGRVPPTSAVG